MQSAEWTNEASFAKFYRRKLNETYFGQVGYLLITCSLAFLIYILLNALAIYDVYSYLLVIAGL